MRHSKGPPTAPRPLRAGRAVALVLVAFVAAGCLPGMRRVALRPTSATELLDSLAARRAAVRSLRARVRLRAGLAGMWVREALLVRRPDAVRMDVLSPFGLALALGTDGAVLWAYPSGEGTRYEGPATPENLAHFLGAPARVEDLVDVLLGVPPARVPAAPPVLRVVDARTYELVIPLADGAEAIRFAGDSLQVIGADETRGSGSALRVAFADYREGFPHAVEVRSGDDDARATLVYDSVEVNPTLDGALFGAPPAPRVLPLPSR